MMNTIKKIIIGFIVGTVCGFSGGVFFSYPGKAAPAKTETRTIYGAPLSAVDYTDTSGVHIDADYSGAGKSALTIPFDRIPPAAAWIEKRRAVSVMVSPRGALYALGSYRVGAFTLSGGVRVPLYPVSAAGFDILAGAGWWF